MDMMMTPKDVQIVLSILTITKGVLTISRFDSLFSFDRTINCCEPIIFLLKFNMALIQGLPYMSFESFPIVSAGIYGLRLIVEGLTFIGVFLGALLVVLFLILG